MYTEIRKALYDALAANAAFASLVGTRVYFAYVPASTALPYAVMSLASGGDVNDSGVHTFDVQWNVKVVTDSGQDAETGEAAIRAALHEATLGDVNKVKFLRCQVVAHIGFVEHDDRVQYWHSGAAIRIRGTYEE